MSYNQPSFANRPRVSLLITDLDNTLYDWFEIWYGPFSAMLDTVVKMSGVESSVLEKEIRAVHQKRRTSEYSYLLDELPSLKSLHPDQKIAEVYSDAIRRFRSERKRKRRLYPDVRETLEYVKNRGTKIVAYTESLAFYTAQRILHLELDGIIDYVYSPKDHGFPEGVTPQSLRTQPPDAYKFEYTEHRFTPEDKLKPAPDILRLIICEIGGNQAEVAYIGDSLMKDVAMAQDAGVYDVWARYGLVQHKAEYDLLRRVSHWSEEDVLRERELSEGATVSPSFILYESMKELRQLFEFVNL
jgi:phosphoglycolate phosphatase